ncbi:FGGY-family carbohydrate kinase [Streptomyces sp. BK340]|uniref:xylulokinase n=1 Tax=Streptomyces sp. BK340 TaxID=2572903 RepID=UPI0016458475|nr:FGGY-family carbohydrate kinase [Streptomyces sp. BK340]
MLALDIGTSAVKAGLFALDGRLLRFARGECSDISAPEPGAAEQDPNHWWAAVCRTVSDVMSVGAPAELRAICAVGQSPVLVLSDAAGRPVRPAISWMDARAERQRAAIAERLGDTRPGFNLLHRLLWLMENEPASVGKACWALSPWDFIGHRLTGGTAAAASGLSGAPLWPTAEVEAAGLSGAAVIPPHQQAGTVYGRTEGPWSAQLGLPDGIPVVAGMADALATMLGSGAVRPGRAADTGGSSGGLALCSPEEITGLGIGSVPGVAPGTFAVGGPFAAGGKATQWWADTTAGGDVAQVIAAAEQAPAGSGGVLFLPFLAGERAPVWDHTASGAFLGLTLRHGPTHLARAVIESSGYSLRWLTETLGGAGAVVSDIRVCGRQAGSELWNAIKADVTGRTILMPETTETTLMGAAITAGVGAECFTNLWDASEEMVRIARAVTPDPRNKGRYDDLFALYQGAYQALRPLYPALSKP